MPGIKSSQSLSLFPSTLRVLMLFICPLSQMSTCAQSMMSPWCLQACEELGTDCLVGK